MIYKDLYDKPQTFTWCLKCVKKKGFGTGTAHKLKKIQQTSTIHYALKFSVQVLEIILILLYFYH